ADGAAVGTHGARPLVPARALRQDRAPARDAAGAADDGVRAVAGRRPPLRPRQRLLRRRVRSGRVARRGDGMRRQRRAQPPRRNGRPGAERRDGGVKGADMTANAVQPTSMHDAATREPIAIIGMACMFPQAPDLGSFWRNIVGGVDAVGEPTASWDAKRYLDSGRIKTAAGGFLKDLFRFEPREFGIMPNSIDGGEPDQFLALRIARDALADAGYLEGFDHRDTGIVLGHSTYLHRGQGAILQNTLVLDQTLDILEAACPAIDAGTLAEIRA